MDGNIKDTPPIILVPRPEDRPRWDAAGRELADAPQAGRRGARQAARADFDKWLADGQAASRSPRAIPADGLAAARRR